MTIQQVSAYLELNPGLPDCIPVPLASELVFDLRPLQYLTVVSYVVWEARLLQGCHVEWQRGYLF